MAQARQVPGQGMPVLGEWQGGVEAWAPAWGPGLGALGQANKRQRGGLRASCRLVRWCWPAGARCTAPVRVHTRHYYLLHYIIVLHWTPTHLNVLLLGLYGCRTLSLPEAPLGLQQRARGEAGSTSDVGSRLGSRPAGRQGDRGSRPAGRRQKVGSRQAAGR